MTWVLIIAGIILVLVGLAGSLLPALPGPPIAYGGLLLQQLRDPNPFTTNFMLVWLGIVLIVIVLDYYIPIWGTKKFGGSKYGMWGCTLGFLAAFWMGPWGVVIGPFVGAFVGELIASKPSNQALRAAFGAFLGFLGGSFIKIAVCIVMGYHLIKTI
jgi:uncharacterized protein YqgC (DUF456 family)